MTPTPEQIRAAVRNRSRPPRTPGARLRDAMEHVKKKGRIMSPALSDISQNSKRTCTGCRIPFRPRRSQHRLCLECWRWSQHFIATRAAWRAIQEGRA